MIRLECRLLFSVEDSYTTLPSMMSVFLEGRVIIKMESYKSFDITLLRGCVIQDFESGCEYVCYSAKGRMKVISCMTLFCSNMAEIFKEQREQTIGFLKFLRDNEVENIKDIVQLFRL